MLTITTIVAVIVISNNNLTESNNNSNSYVGCNIKNTSKARVQKASCDHAFRKGSEGVDTWSFGIQSLAVLAPGMWEVASKPCKIVMGAHCSHLALLFAVEEVSRSVSSFNQIATPTTSHRSGNRPT